MWVVLGHIFFYFIPGTVNIQTSLEKTTMLTYPFLIVEAAFFSVDIFFFIAGFLLAYVFLKDVSKGFIKFPTAIFQRMLRLWPSYIFAILIYYSVYLHLGNGPNWGTDEKDVKYCNAMWKPLIFVDNLV
jgi:peptidoglycan/LPS O-acetylase OafA/YrhL